MASVTSASPSRQDYLRANSSTEDTDSWQHVDSSSPGFTPSPGSSYNGWGIIGYPNYLGASPQILSPTSHPSQQSSLSMTGGDSENQFLSFLDNQQLMENHELLFPNLLDGITSNYQFQSNAQEDNMGDITSFEGMDVQAQPADLGIPLQFQHDNHVDPWAPEFMFFDMEDVSARMSRTTSQGSAAISSLRSSPKIPSAKPRHSKDADPVKKVRGGGRVEKKKKAAAPATTSDNFVIFTPNSVNNQPGKPNLFECFEVAGGVQRGRKGPLAGKAAERARNIRRMGACFCCRSRKVSCDEERPCKNCKKISTQLPQVVCWQFSDFLPVLFPGFIRGHFKKDAMTRFISDNVSKFYSVSSSSTSSSSSPWLIELSSGLRFRSTLILPASFCAPKSAEVLHHWHVSAGESAHHLDLYSRLAVPVGIDPKDSNQREALRRRTREYIASLVSEPLYAAQVTDSLRGTKLPQRVLEIVQRYAQRSSHHSSAAMVKRALGIYAAHYVLTRQLCLTPATLDRLHHLQQTQPEKLPFLLSPGIISAHHSSFTTTRILNRQIKAVLDEFLLKETQSLFTSFGAALKPRSRAEWASCLASFLVLCLLFEGIEAAADIFMVSEAEVALRSRRRSNSIINANNSVFDAAAATTTTMTTTDANKPGGFAVGGRRQALEVCREIDNLPFRQVAYRFHAVYQTHHVREPGVGCPMGSSSTTTTTTSSSAGGNSSSGAGTGNGNGNGGSGGAGLTFNPLLDPSLDADLEPAAAEMAASLRSLLDIDGSWHELDFLTADPILSQAEAHPYPRDITLDYTGRLLARFLLSFTDERYLFDGQY